MAFEKFVNRHNGPGEKDIPGMLETIGVSSIDQLIDETVPDDIRLQKPLNLPPAMSEFEYLAHLRKLGSKNKQFRSFIGMGYYGTGVLPVVVRNILENPAWYTSYTPYQAEISQGRLEALLNFQTMVAGLTGMELANASLLDEATAGAEAMIMMYNARSRAAVKAEVNKIFVDSNIFPQTLDVIITRAEPLGIDVIEGDFSKQTIDDSFFGAIIQYPAADGDLPDYKNFADMVHEAGALLGAGTDLMSLALLTPPGEWGADIVFGCNQRFGLPMGYGGPHAGFFATREELKRNMPGRIIGVSVDSNGKLALRMALQTREQHIKRERATSNICTAQALLATMSAIYGQYHGPEGLKRIALHIFQSTCTLKSELEKLGYKILNKQFFDTLSIGMAEGVTIKTVAAKAHEAGINFAWPGDGTVRLSLDEISTINDINAIISVFGESSGKKFELVKETCDCICIDKSKLRTSKFLAQEAFNRYHSETAMMRYIKMLERKDYSLAQGMIPLGSCTMKLNPASSMFAMSWPEFGNIHPFVPADQAAGYHQVMNELGEALKEICGFSAISFQPNSGAAGEYAGLMVIRQYHQSRGNDNRNIVLIPSSAHGTNPASGVMAGMKVIVVECDDQGNIDIKDLQAKAEEHKDNLAACMITYPSTHGVYEEGVNKMTDIIHKYGGQVYMDGANMNAQVGLTNPGLIGADVCHLNLHKTFAIPHGGGGPGMGPILVADHLAEFLPNHPVIETGGSHGTSAVAAAPYGSASILTISHAYVLMLGAEGLLDATRYAILNANYLASALKGKFEILYKGKMGRVAHEMILNCHEFKHDAGISEGDIAKRLMDYGFHAPTLSFPVHGTLMVEPTESEPLSELDRFVDAMNSIYDEIMEVKEGIADKEDNVLHNAPHTAESIIAGEWKHPYSREKAAYPLKWVIENKFWPSVGRVDNGYGDRNLVCTCDPVDSYRFSEDD
ncbi:MAG: aminomethyl-transferring glycine dehydrogenase [Marinilabiliaceae bacterium]|jgi:glycine dehydrogenase|nr:aminomethyl-transferring glycine dehydrogenase [Marinilabiliaceae bacterium]